LFLDPPLVRVSLKPGAWVEPIKMTQSIRDAGFTPVPEEVSLTVTGTLESRAGRFVLVLDRMEKLREIVCVSGRDTELQPNLGKTVEIEGRWRFDDGALLVDKITLPGQAP